MKTHLLAISVTTSTLSMLSACGGGPGSVLSKPFAPTVTVSAPTTARAGSAFTIDWSSTGATSCIADFDSETGTSASVSKTETTGGTKTYSVTCSGAGGSATNSATVQVADAAALAEGLWQGNTGSGRGISGVVTKEGDYWLVYTRSANDSTVVGFYTGQSTSTETTPPNGTLSSTNLREVNFDTGNTEQGKITSANYSAKTSLSGSFDPVTGATVASADFSVVHTGTIAGIGSFAGLLSGTITDGGTGTAHLDNGGTLTVTDNYVSTTNIGGTQNIGETIPFTGSFANGVFTASAGISTKTSCTGPNCSLGDTTYVTVTGSIDATLTNSGTINTHYISNGIANVDEAFALTVTNITYSGNALPPITADSFNLGTYNSTYESAAALTTIAGSYTTGSTGIDSAIHADASLTVASDGSVTGTESVSHCNYSATIAPHATGNVYDVTALTFSSSGGTCIYASSGAFVGAATYDATVKKLTLTALNANRDQGFLVIATQP